MANDAYIVETEEEAEQWELMEQELHEHNVFYDVVELIEQKGLPYVLSGIIKRLEEKEA